MIIKERDFYCNNQNKQAAISGYHKSWLRNLESVKGRGNKKTDENINVCIDYH